MNKFKYYFIVLITTLSLFSCSKDNATEAETIREYSVQYTTDIATIEEYLKTTYITVINHSGFADDQDVTFTLIPVGGTQTSIWNQTTYPILTRYVSVNQNDVDITYKIYYIQLRQVNQGIFSRVISGTNIFASENAATPTPAGTSFMLRVSSEVLVIVSLICSISSGEFSHTTFINAFKMTPCAFSSASVWNA